jgi:disulfide bond formation protein DsbB
MNNITEMFDNFTQWNYSVMTWINGTSLPGHVDVNVLGMDYVIVLLAGIFTLLACILYVLIQTQRRD